MTDWLRSDSDDDIGEFSLHIVNESTIFMNISIFSMEGGTFKDGSPLPDLLHFTNVFINEEQKVIVASIRFHGNPISLGWSYGMLWDTTVEYWKFLCFYEQAIRDKQMLCYWTMVNDSGDLVEDLQFKYNFGNYT